MVNIFYKSSSSNAIRGPRGPAGPAGDPASVTLAPRGGLVKNKAGELGLAHLKLLYTQTDTILRDDPRSYRVIHLTLFIESGVERYQSTTFVMASVGANPFLPIQLRVGSANLTIQTTKDGKFPFRRITPAGVTNDANKLRWTLITVYGAL